VTATSRARYAAAAGLFWPVAGITANVVDALILQTLGGSAFPDGFALGVMGWLEWSALAPLVVLTALALQRARIAGARLFVAHAALAAATSFVHAALYFSLRTIFTGRPGLPGESAVGTWIAHMDVHLEMDLLVYTLTVAAVHAALSLRRRADAERAGEELQQHIAGAELELLKMQLPEGLLTRMLVRIEQLATTDPGTAEQLISTLSRLLRSALALASPNRALKHELVLARDFAAADAAVRERPFAVELRVPDDIASVSRPTQVMLPILVSVGRDAAAGEAPVVTVDVQAAEDHTVVRWTISGVRRFAHVRTLVQHLRLQLPPGKSISLRGDSGYFVLEYERRADAGDETPAMGVAGTGDAAEPPRRPPFELAVVLITIYPPLEAFTVSLLALLSRLLEHRPMLAAPFAAVGPAAVAAPAGLCLAWIAWRLRSRRHRAAGVLALGIGALLGPMACMVFFSAWMAALQPHRAVFAELVRRQVLTSYRTTDFLIFFGIAVGVLAYGRQFASEERQYENRLLDRQLARTHAQVLKDQLNPHFLFNALNSIVALLDRDQTAAAAMTAKLREYLALVLGMAERHEVPLREELECTMRYLVIEKIRFGERLAVHVDVHESALDALVPNLLLQPLIENAVKHGLAPIRGGAVFIRAEVEHGRLVIAVSDNGRGTRGRARPEGIGMQNVRNRLRQLHGTASTVEVEDHAGGYGVAIRLPLQR
jgi:two-component sensor histidine kinase